ncbi:MAG: hypothetical protein QM564_09515 [Bergeyella sp.]
MTQTFALGFSFVLAGNVNDGDRITLDYFEETGLVFRPVEK